MKIFRNFGYWQGKGKATLDTALFAFGSKAVQIGGRGGGRGNAKIRRETGARARGLWKAAPLIKDK